MNARRVLAHADVNLDHLGSVPTQLGIDIDVESRIDEQFRAEQIAHDFLDLAETTREKDRIVRERFYETFLLFVCLFV